MYIVHCAKGTTSQSLVRGDVLVTGGWRTPPHPYSWPSLTPWLSILNLPVHSVGVGSVGGVGSVVSILYLQPVHSVGVGSVHLQVCRGSSRPLDPHYLSSRSPLFQNSIFRQKTAEPTSTLLVVF